jgi:hypothetical protein
MIVRAGPWVDAKSIQRDKTGRVIGVVSINGRKPLALEHRTPGLVRVLFEKPHPDREPLPERRLAMPEYVWDGAF